MNHVVEYKPKPLDVRHEHIKSMLRLEAAIAQLPNQLTIEGTTKHHHCEGVYVREFSMPSGYVCTGMVHRFACINILIKGRIKVVQSDREEIISAPHIYISEPGEKKALYALEDCTFVTCHATDETDTDKLWEHFTVSQQQVLEEIK